MSLADFLNVPIEPGAWLQLRRIYKADLRFFGRVPKGSKTAFGEPILVV
jgi:hypothetical protein